MTLAPPIRTNGQRTTPSVLDTMEILEFLRGQAPRQPSVTEISRALGISKATCHTILQTLLIGRFVLQDPLDKSYALGPALIGLGRTAAAETPAEVAARAALPGLAQLTGFGASAWKPVATGHLVAVARAEGTRSLQIAVTVGLTVPLSPPFGTSYLAWAPAGELERWFGVARAGGFAPAPGADLEAYLEDLEGVRARGFSHSIRVAPDSAAGLAELEEWLDRAGAIGLERRSAAARSAFLRGLRRLGDLAPEHRGPDSFVLPAPLVSIGAPVFDHEARPVLGIAILGFAGEIPPERVPALGAQIRDTADSITDRTGGHSPETLPDLAALAGATDLEGEIP
jgi:DNA-binding IclR family transcriptional regulator